MLDEMEEMLNANPGFHEDRVLNAKQCRSTNVQMTERVRMRAGEGYRVW
jgi:hypothetical protein